MRATVTAIALVLTLVAACGSRTGFSTDVEPAEPAPDAAPPKRVCSVTLCTIGHECCVGGCAGPAAAMPSDCCPCLPGEVNSMTCPRGRCAR